jgi:beta-N-acetylhexosaminidase
MTMWGNMPLALITDCEGPTLLDAEIQFFRESQPFGFILFQRHCENPEQVRNLTAQLQACVDNDAPIFIDQEGGRVARLKPPHWEEYPAAANFGAADERACYLNARLMADALRDVGITADCAPLADIPAQGSHDIIGDRAFGCDAQTVIRYARAQASGLMDGGVLPVLKHIPGHGRALADSHLELPRVDAPQRVLEQTDFEPFKALRDLTFAMTAHIVYECLDAERPATLSPTIIRYVREIIGYEGLLMSDDISMKALSGSLDDIARDTLAAGCDLVLHCNGSLKQRQLAARGCADLPANRYALYERAKAAIAQPEAIERSALRAERDALLVA